MTTPDYTLEFIDPSGKPHTSMDVTHPGDGKGGEIKLSISPNRPAGERENAYKEYQELAKVLGINAEMVDGNLVMNTGSRSPEGVVFFMAHDLDKGRGLVVADEGVNAIKTVLERANHGPGQNHEVQASMMAALNQAKESGISMTLAKSGTRHTTQLGESSIAQVVPKVAEPGVGKGREVV